MKYITLIFLLASASSLLAEPEDDELETRLIGGYIVSPFSLPYMVFLKMNSTVNAYCGGSLVSENYVLTAANCTYKAPAVITTVLGAYNLSRDEATQVFIESDQIITHPDWNITTGENDIALIKLKTPAPSTIYIKPIELSDETESIIGKFGWASGWGRSHYASQKLSPVLLRIDIEIIENGRCASAFGSDKISANQICADGYGPYNICGGDYGDPFVVDGKQIGIASFSGNPCDLGKPNVFTDIRPHRTWIAGYID